LAPGFYKGDLWLPSFTAEEFLQQCGSAGVGRANLIQMTWYGLDHSYIEDLIAADPGRFVGTGIVPAVTDVALPSPDKTMLELSRRGIYAFRVRGRSRGPKLGTGERWMDHPGYDKMFRAGAEHNLALSFLMWPDDLPELDRMCRLHPETPVIIDHLCLIGTKGVFPEEQINALCAMATHRRVMVKVGAFYAFGSRKPPYLDLLPLIRRVVDAFGPERCMWESDSPLVRPGSPVKDPSCDCAAAVALIRDHADFLSSTDREQILIRTAEDFFFNR
jgi:predicted TIM-barrel fold metal-dependent hydrolase